MSSNDPLKAWPEVRALLEHLEGSSEVQAPKPAAQAPAPRSAARGGSARTPVSRLELGLWGLGAAALLATCGLSG